MGIGGKNISTVLEDDTSTLEYEFTEAEDGTAARLDNISSWTNTISEFATALEAISEHEENSSQPEIDAIAREYDEISPEDKVTILNKDTRTVEDRTTVPEGSTPTITAPADASFPSCRHSYRDTHSDLAKNSAALYIDEQSKRIEDLEELLWSSEEQRYELQDQVADLKGRLDETVAMYETFKENRNKDNARYLDRLADRDRERDRLQASLKLLEDQLVEARGTRANSCTSVGRGRERGGVSAGGQQLLQQQRVEALTSELLRTRDALADSQKKYWEARCEISRLGPGQFSSAAQAMDYCRRLVDPHSRLYATMMATVRHRDGAGPPPTEEQRADLRLFRDYLWERAEVLREAMGLDDPRPALEPFDDEWAAEAARNDWGATVMLRLCATRAATAVRFGTGGGTGLAELAALKSSMALSRERMGEDYRGDVGEEVNDMYDELQKMEKQPQARA